MTPRDIRLAIHQMAPVLRDVEENARRIVTAADEAGADLVVTPELSLTGYDLRDDAAALALPLETGGRVPLPGLEAAGADLVVGLVERASDGVVYNAAVHVRAGRIGFRHRKIYLPTYGMFDEGRFFGRGRRVETFEPGGGWRVGVLICEDFWHPALPYLIATRGAHLLIVQAAAPGRGVWTGGETGGRFGSWDAWVRMARTTAQLYGMYVALANRVGVEGGVTFAGGSLIVDPTGAVVAAAPDDAEATIHARLSLDEVARARSPGAHARDDDPEFTLRELARIIEEERHGAR